MDIIKEIAGLIITVGSSGLLLYLWYFFFMKI